MGEPPVTPADPTGIDEYAEVEIDRISPDWGQGVIATHTIMCAYIGPEVAQGPDNSR